MHLEVHDGHEQGEQRLHHHGQSAEHGCEQDEHHFAGEDHEFPLEEVLFIAEVQLAIQVAVVLRILVAGIQLRLDATQLAVQLDDDADVPDYDSTQCDGQSHPEMVRLPALSPLVVIQQRHTAPRVRPPVLVVRECLAVQHRKGLVHHFRVHHEQHHDERRAHLLPLLRLAHLLHLEILRLLVPVVQPQFQLVGIDFLLHAVDLHLLLLAQALPLQPLFALLSTFPLRQPPGDPDADVADDRREDGEYRLELVERDGVPAAGPEERLELAVDAVGARAGLVDLLGAAGELGLDLVRPGDRYLVSDDADDLQLVDQVPHEHAFTREDVLLVPCTLQVGHDRLLRQENLHAEAHHQSRHVEPHRWTERALAGTHLQLADHALLAKVAAEAARTLR